MKKVLCTLYIAVIVTMAVATFAEKATGRWLYGEWWFTVLWALLTAAGIAWLLKHRVRRPYAVVLHLSFVVILAGALLTHLLSRQGVLHLRQGVPSTQYVTDDGLVHQLPFTLSLDTFRIVYHEGTRAVADYASELTVTDNADNSRHVTVSMNNIFADAGIRLYQSSYDPDGHGTVLTLNSDPWGIPVTYTGYALLFVALIWMLIDPKGTYRQLLRQMRQTRAAGLLVLAMLTSTGMTAAPANDNYQTVLPVETATHFGRLNMLYNNRICPVQTFAIDFTKALCGKPHYGSYTAEQVLTGFLFYPEHWRREPIVKVKSSELRQLLALNSGHCAVNDFFTADGYRLGQLVSDFYQLPNSLTPQLHDSTTPQLHNSTTPQLHNSTTPQLHKEAMKMDDKLMQVMGLHEFAPLKLFPFDGLWYGPADSYPATIEPDRKAYFSNILALMASYAQSGDFDRLDEAIDKVAQYQQRYGGASLPSPQRLQAERCYNAVPFATILFMVNLTMGLLTFGLFIAHRQLGRHNWIATFVMLLSWLALTTCLALRWIIRGSIPLSNGYETTLFMAWLIMLLTLAVHRRFTLMLTMGFLMSGFFLLVSHISQMDPQIGHLMPVLRSPLLTIHVSIIMMAYALLSLTFVCGLMAAIVHRQAAELQLLSQLMLYPAITCLGLGIFIGAIWANISWGNYWSWDPKETWALITFMVYIVPLHAGSFPAFRRPLVYHTYVTLSFLTILMTYFGVNYFLGGMHAYA